MRCSSELDSGRWKGAAGVGSVEVWIMRSGPVVIARAKALFVSFDSVN